MGQAEPNELVTVCYLLDAWNSCSTIWAWPTETGTQAIDRAAELLVRVVESRGRSPVTELADRSGLPK